MDSTAGGTTGPIPPRKGEVAPEPTPERVEYGQNLDSFLIDAQAAYSQPGPANDPEKVQELALVQEGLGTPELHAAALLEVYLWMESLQGQLDSQRHLPEGVSAETLNEQERIRLIFMGNCDSMYQKRFPEQTFPVISRENVAGGLKEAVKEWRSGCSNFADFSPLLDERASIANQTVDQDTQTQVDLSRALAQINELCWAGCISLEETLRRAAATGSLKEIGPELNNYLVQAYRLELLRDVLEKEHREALFTNRQEPAVVESAQAAPEAPEQAHSAEGFDALSQRWGATLGPHLDNIGLRRWLDEDMPGSPDFNVFGEGPENLKKWRVLATAYGKIKSTYLTDDRPKPEKDPEYYQGLGEMLDMFEVKQ